ncbi:hypothetical protein AB6A40_001944 [Gnathostoma spinigerum]|uniref:General transcription factor 3C polypeptide 5 n=1 Tax=Gnathostoma spinigerum TaxID=75299 RepID=A0ABD6E6E1_9BILA
MRTGGRNAVVRESNASFWFDSTHWSNKAVISPWVDRQLAMFNSLERITPLNETKEYVVVAYPGIVKNVDKAIETLGGMNILSTTHCAGRPLELRHKPANPYSNAIVSERRITEKFSAGSGCVLGVVKVRRKKKDPNFVEAEVIGLVSTVYSFKSMCDFQYLPLGKVERNDNHYEDMVPRLIPNDMPSSLSWWEQPDGSVPTPIFLPPYQYSRYNQPSTKILCRETDFSVNKIKKSKNAGHGQSLRSERKSLSITVHADDEFPSAPSQEAVNDANLRCKNEEPHRLLSELLLERPMWTRVAICRRTGLDDSILKTVIQKFCFYILNGPWGRLWCKFGYDPRRDPEAKKYQSVMVTFRQHSRIPERQRLKVVNLSTDRALPVSLTGSAMLSPAHGSSLNVPGSFSIDYSYHPGQLPRVRQMWYSICDVHLPEAEEILRKEYFQLGNQADVNNGWLPPNAIDEIRNAIKEDVKKVSKQIEQDDEFVTYGEEDDWTF